MVPPASHRVSRVLWYSGSCQALGDFTYGAFTLSGRLSQNRSAISLSPFRSPQPRHACTPVWAPPISLAATLGIDVSFFSSGYLDVSVPRVPFHTLWIGVWIHEVCSCGFPHSDISGSMDICSSPKLFAAYHVFHRLLVPRHPPCALSCLALPDTIALVPDGLGCCLVFVSQFAVSYYSASFSSLSLRLTYSRCFVYAVFKVRCWQSINTLPSGLKWTRTTDLTLIRRAL